jgi:ribonuclease P protein component
MVKTANKSYTLERYKKLCNGDNFNNVFLNKRVFTTEKLKIHYVANNLEHPRLGVIVSRKNHKRAHVRNYMKRVTRELFRLNQYQLPNIDIIVRFNYNFDENCFLQVKHEFERFIYRMEKNKF